MKIKNSTKVPKKAQHLLPSPRAMSALEGVLDAVEGEFESAGFSKELAPLGRLGLALLLSVGSEGGKPFAIDTGDGVAVMVRPVDAKAVAARTLDAWMAGAVHDTVREQAKRSFLGKIGARPKKGPS